MPNAINQNTLFKRFNKALRFFIIIIFAYLSLAPNSIAGDHPFNKASNWGTTGLLETPSARILEDGHMRLAYTNADPYIWYTGAIGIVPGVELVGQFTEITNVDAELGSDYGGYKDKAFGIKYQAFSETKNRPAFSFGVNDSEGTQLFKSQYVVLNRQIYPFDFTLGYGWGRMDGLFGGIEWALTDRFRVLTEYNPIQYEEDEIQGIPDSADSPINVGLKATIFSGIDIGLSFQRGDTIGLMCSIDFELGKPISPKKPDPRHWTSFETCKKGFWDRQTKIKKIRDALLEAKFKNVFVSRQKNRLFAEFENTRYLSDEKAAGRALRILAFNADPDIDEITIILKRRKLPLLKISVKPEHFKAFIFGEIPENLFKKLVRIESYKTDADVMIGSMVESFIDNPITTYGIKPDIYTFFNDPSGAFKWRLGFQPYLTSTFWKGGTFVTRYDIPLYSDISSSNDPSDDAVRSDAWEYYQENPAVERLMLDQVLPVFNNTFARVSGGYLERMYAGVGGEVLTFLGSGNVAIGIESDWVRKRDPDAQLGTLDHDAQTLLGNLYYRFPLTGLTLKSQYGRFLAGDEGFRFEVKREYDTGAVFGFWYSMTDTSDFTDFNRDYHDKGVYLALPLRMFSKDESRTRYRYQFKPWTRDVGATVSHWQNLFDFGSDLTPSKFKSNLHRLKE